jgi:hypothetical protein
LLAELHSLFLLALNQAGYYARILAKREVLFGIQVSAASLADLFSSSPKSLGDTIKQ